MMVSHVGVGSIGILSMAMLVLWLLLLLRVCICRWGLLGGHGCKRVQIVLGGRFVIVTGRHSHRAVVSKVGVLQIHGVAEHLVGALDRQSHGHIVALPIFLFCLGQVSIFFSLSTWNSFTKKDLTSCWPSWWPCRRAWRSWWPRTAAGTDTSPDTSEWAVELALSTAKFEHYFCRTNF